MLMLDYPLRVNFKKIESSYSKFSMLLPNVQSPRLSRLVYVLNQTTCIGPRFENLIIFKVLGTVTLQPFDQQRLTVPLWNNFDPVGNIGLLKSEWLIFI